MIIALESYIQKLVDSYRGTTELLNNEVIGIIEKVIAHAARAKEEFNVDVDLSSTVIQNGVVDNILEAISKAEKLSEVLNQKLKLVIAGAKDEILTEISKAEIKPADYAVKIGNALLFLDDEGDTLTDESAYLILKDFVNDFEQMRLFKRRIEK